MGNSLEILRECGAKTMNLKTLENLKDQLQPDNFFKINRQFIVSINAIKRVYSYFNGKLKLEIEPSHAEDIIVGKDKASTFKRWIDK